MAKACDKMALRRFAAKARRLASGHSDSRSPEAVAATTGCRPVRTHLVQPFRNTRHTLRTEFNKRARSRLHECPGHAVGDRLGQVAEERPFRVCTSISAGMPGVGEKPRHPRQFAAGRLTRAR